MALYEICGLPVDIYVRYKQLEERAKPFLCEENHTPVMFLTPDDGELVRLGMECNYDLGWAEYQQSCVNFCEGIINYNGFVLHASAVKTDDGCFLFSAPSGIGKSTHTAIWKKLFGGTVINDDKPAIRIINGVPTAFGTPWCGKDTVRENDSAEVKALYFIKRAKENRAYRIDNDTAVYLMLESMYRPLAESGMDKLCDTLDSFVKAVPVFALECDISDNAAQTAYSAWRDLQ